MFFTSVEMWLYGGIALIFLALFLAILCLIIFRITGRRIHKQMEQEYGKPQLYSRQ